MADLEKWVEEARELRAKMFEAEVSFFEYLRKGEIEQDFWRGAFTSFEHFLKNYDLCDAARYADYKASMVVLRKPNPAIGVDGMIIAARASTDTRRRDIVTAFERFTHEKQHPPSRKEAQRLAQEIDPKERVPKVLSRARDVADLEKENRALRARVKDLEREVASLKKQLGKTPVMKPRSSARHRSQPHA